MNTKQVLDDLIHAGWQVIESDFDSEAIMSWRKRARDCVVVLMGPDHPYAQFFDAFVAKGPSTNLLAGAGILEAMKEQIATGKCTSDDSDLRSENTPERDGGNF